ncbi:unnamed protein product [Ilex paraguariensis]|uniref:Uncharacterized protein n=1 Tax=Ilex paraguariensis TaxID=185542 RepID=A0ABC8U669_9AQUA
MPSHPVELIRRGPSAVELTHGELYPVELTQRSSPGPGLSQGRSPSVELTHGDLCPMELARTSKGWQGDWGPAIRLKASKESISKM